MTDRKLVSDNDFAEPCPQPLPCFHTPLPMYRNVVMIVSSRECDTRADNARHELASFGDRVAARLIVGRDQKHRHTE
jgi:hypothetical protein